jgi:hypothetical protein
MPRSRRQGYHRGDTNRSRSVSTRIGVVGGCETSCCPPTVIIVTTIVATSFSFPSLTAMTSPWQTVSVRPGFVTRPRATSRSPCAGDRKLIFYSMVSTSAFGGVSVIAAYPHAESPITPITPPWKNPCCCVTSALNGTSISTLPAVTRPRIAPTRSLKPCREKLARIRRSKIGIGHVEGHRSLLKPTSANRYAGTTI